VVARDDRELGRGEKLTVNDAERNDDFGNAVAISGDAIIVGTFEPGGAAYIFSRDEGGTNELGQGKKLNESTFGFNDNFGRAVAISRNIAIVGALGANALEVNSAAACIFARNQGGANFWGE